MNDGYSQIARMQAKKAQWELRAPLANTRPVMENLALRLKQATRIGIK